MYFSAKEILAQLEGTDKRICDLVIQNETELFETPYDKIMEMLEERYQIMYNSAHDALEKEIRSLSGLTGGSARKMWDYYKKGSMICDGTIIRGAAYALSCLEVNASMGLIVAAPTAGACGILPGCLLTVAEKHDIPHQQVLEALATASGIGQLIVKRRPSPAQRAAARPSAAAPLRWLRALWLRCWAAPLPRPLTPPPSRCRTSWAWSATRLQAWSRCPAPNATPRASQTLWSARTLP